MNRVRWTHFGQKLKCDRPSNSRKKYTRENSRFVHSFIHSFVSFDSLIENRYLFIFGNIIPFSAFIFGVSVCRLYGLTDTPNQARPSIWYIYLFICSDFFLAPQIKKKHRQFFGFKRFFFHAARVIICRWQSKQMEFSAADLLIQLLLTVCEQFEFHNRLIKIK